MNRAFVFLVIFGKNIELLLKLLIRNLKDMLAGKGSVSAVFCKLHTHLTLFKLTGGRHVMRIDGVYVRRLRQAKFLIKLVLS